MDKYAVIRLNGHQHQLKLGEIVEINGTLGEEGKSITIGEVLLLKSQEVQIGTPVLDEKATFKVVEHGRSKKIEVFKYKSKSRYRRKQGHRQDVTRLQLIQVGDLKYTAPAKKAKTSSAKATSRTISTKQSTAKTSSKSISTKKSTSKKEEIKEKSTAKSKSDTTAKTTKPPTKKKTTKTPKNSPKSTKKASTNKSAKSTK